MPRRSTGPRYYATKKGYYAFLNGRRIPLASGPEKDPAVKKAAWEKYRAEAAAASTEVDGDHGTVGQVLNAYLNNCSQRGLTENTMTLYGKVLQAFTHAHGKMKVRELRPRHVQQFLADMRQPRPHPKKKTPVFWADGMVRRAIDVLATAFNWAENEELVSRSPLRRQGGKSIARPVMDYRAGRAAITEAEHQALLDETGRRRKRDFHYLLQFWWGTGCRPAEMALARADEWDETRRAFVIRATDPRNRGRFKLARLKKDRVVYVPDDLAPLARKLVASAADREGGYLFLNERGRPYTFATIDNRFFSLRRWLAHRAAKQGLPSPIRDHVTCYGYRHAFVTRWLVAGHDAQKLCELLNTSLDMLRKHYSHLFEEHESLREALNGFTQSRPETPATPPSVLPWRAAGTA